MSILHLMTVAAPPTVAGTGYVRFCTLRYSYKVLWKAQKVVRFDIVYHFNICPHCIYMGPTAFGRSFDV